MNTLYFGLYDSFGGGPLITYLAVTMQKIHSPKGILTTVKPTSTHNCGIFQFQKYQSRIRIANWVFNPETSAGQGSEHDLINGHHYRKVV